MRGAGAAALPHGNWNLVLKSGQTFAGPTPHVAEAILNHISGHKAGVAGTYNHAGYEPEKREALELWAAHLDHLLSTSKLTSGENPGETGSQVETGTRG
jgi:hypothetical protein